MRRLLVNEYITKFKLTQAEIAKLFGTTDRTIRNWLADEKNH
jgi:predicted transcriptional regulator